MRKAGPPREIPPPLEMECLKALWRIGEGSVRDVRAVVAERRPLAYTTVMTVMERLVRRGAIARRKSGRAFRYSPVVERETLRQRAIREFVETYFDGSQSALREWLDSAPPRAAAAGEETADRLDAALL
jgi:BlaI family penicillinase repressor